jgi:hypothetical protein
MKRMRKGNRKDRLRLMTDRQANSRAEELQENTKESTSQESST